VVQTAAKLLLEPIFEADFDPHAYGYRPKRSAQDAIQEVHEFLHSGYTDVVDADLSKFAPARQGAAWTVRHPSHHAGDESR
jgi:RNA-directed DNA polymerase